MKFILLFLLMLLHLGNVTIIYVYVCVCMFVCTCVCMQDQIVCQSMLGNSIKLHSPSRKLREGLADVISIRELVTNQIPLFGNIGIGAGPAGPVLARPLSQRFKEDIFQNCFAYTYYSQTKSFLALG